MTMRKATRNAALLALLAVSGAALVLTASSTQASDRAEPKPSEAEALQAFLVVQKVLQHPRCQNCHIPGDAPLQFDDSRVHAQNVRRGPQGKGAPGLACATCHATANPPVSYGPNMPPGAPNWQLPPPQHKMVFINLSTAELCRGLKNRKENGDRDLKALLEHVSHDKLVLWGWAPGQGRAPVSVPHEELVAAFRTWVAAGGPCPAS